MNRIYDLGGIFHALIITIFLLGLSGCGYKDDPYYQEDAPQSDENVKFIIKNGEKNDGGSEK